MEKFLKYTINMLDHLSLLKAIRMIIERCKSSLNMQNLAWKNKEKKICMKPKRFCLTYVLKQKPREVIPSEDCYLSLYCSFCSIELWKAEMISLIKVVHKALDFLETSLASLSTTKEK